MTEPANQLRHSTNMRKQSDLEDKVLGEADHLANMIGGFLYGDDIGFVDPKRLLRNPNDLTDKIAVVLALNYSIWPDFFNIRDEEIVKKIGTGFKEGFGDKIYQLDEDRLCEMVSAIYGVLPEPKNIEGAPLNIVKGIPIENIRDLRKKLYSGDYKSILSKTENYLRMICYPCSKHYSSKSEKFDVAIRRAFCGGKK